MSPRVLAVIVIAAIAGGIAWFALRKHGDDTVATAPAVAGSDRAPPPTTQADQIPTKAPDQPALPTTDRPTPALPQSPTPQDIYAHEQRDVEWAKETEHAIERKLKDLKGGSLEETECHATQCKLTLKSGDERGMTQAIAQLESKRGLVGFATSMLLTAPTKGADGSLVLNAFATFER